MGQTPLETLTEELRWVAEKLLGKERAEVLDPALVDMAASVNAVMDNPPGAEDEPAFFL